LLKLLVGGFNLAFYVGLFCFVSLAFFLRFCLFNLIYSMEFFLCLFLSVCMFVFLSFFRYFFLSSLCLLLVSSLAEPVFTSLLLLLRFSCLSPLHLPLFCFNFIRPFFSFSLSPLHPPVPLCTYTLTLKPLLLLFHPLFLHIIFLGFFNPSGSRSRLGVFKSLADRSFCLLKITCVHVYMV